MISKKINYFLTLAECLNFAQTAARYEVTQTAISQYIASLEDRIGFRLFDRTRHAVRLTEAGQYYYQHVKELLRNYDSVLERASTLSVGYHECLKVGVGMYEYRSSEELFSKFLISHPEIRVDILQYPYSTLTEKLRLGELDVIIALSICESTFSKKEIRSRTLFESVNMITATPEIYERNNRDVVEMLRNECLVTNCEDDGPSSLKMLNLLLKDEFGFVPEKISQTNTINAQLMMVRAGHGIAIVPKFIADAQCSDLVRIPMPNGDKLLINLMYMPEQAGPAAELLFNFK